MMKLQLFDKSYRWIPIKIQRPCDSVRGYYYNGPCGFVTDTPKGLDNMQDIIDIIDIVSSFDISRD